MHSTDPDIEVLADAINRVQSAAVAIYPEPAVGSDTFFCDCRDLRLFPQKMFEYAFETPSELIVQLEAMWDFQSHPEMKSLAKLCAASTFKQMAVTRKNVGTPTISPFVYEF